MHGMHGMGRSLCLISLRLSLQSIIIHPSKFVRSFAIARTIHRLLLEVGHKPIDFLDKPKDTTR
jgi:hypothetical protein